jgi:probable phosphoglycerate mutase
MIEPTRVFALRHGQTEWNVDQRIQGQLDVPLNGTGLRQAARLAEALADEGLAALYSSDLRRARGTAQALAELTGLAVTADAALRERGFGRFEGLSYAEVEALYPEDARRWRQREPDFGPGGGEALNTFYTRSVAAFGRIAAAHAGQAIAVFSHGGVLDCLYRAALGIELGAPRSWQLGNASINRLLFSGKGFVVLGWSDRAHLEALEEPAARPG